jgi:hypothetical protein
MALRIVLVALEKDAHEHDIFKDHSSFCTTLCRGLTMAVVTINRTLNFRQDLRRGDLHCVFTQNESNFYSIVCRRTSHGSIRSILVRIIIVRSPHRRNAPVRRVFHGKSIVRIL